MPGRLLGKGVFGSVYATTWKDTKVAVKVIPRRIVGLGSQEEYFWQEVNTMVQLRHPNIVQLYGVCDSGDEGYIIVSELLDRDLKATITSNRNISNYTKLRWARDLAVGLAGLHDQFHVVHRDLKPENCLISSEQVLKIGDFGVSFVLKPHASHGDTLAPGSVRLAS